MVLSYDSIITLLLFIITVTVSTYTQVKHPICSVRDVTCIVNRRPVNIRDFSATLMMNISSCGVQCTK